MRTKISLMLPLICAPLAFWGCGDDSGSNSPKTEESSKPFAQVDSVDDLPNCIDKREDSLVVIRDSLGGFRCHNKKWVRYDVVSENEGDLPNCSKSREGFAAYVVDDENVLYCENGKWVEKTTSSSSVEKSSSSSNAKSSSSVDSSSSAKLSSSVAKESSSSAKLSSSVAKGSSSSAKLSSSVAKESSSSAKSSSSVAKESSSSAKSSSSSAKSSSSSAKSSSSAEESPEEIKADDNYKMDCPAGQTCTYAPTAQLNPEIDYGEYLDTRDYQMYKTVTIGEQTWMAQNLNYADSINTISLKERSWCYNNVADSCAKYGRLYTWAAAIDSVALANDADKPQTCGYDKECDIFTAEALAVNPIQGVCPNGWHLPSNAEWNTLITAVGGIESAGDLLKSANGWRDSGNGTDASGFSALSAGYRTDFLYFFNAGRYALFWSALQVESGGKFAFYMRLNYENGEGTAEYAYGKDYGLSVRCIKD